MRVGRALSILLDPTQEPLFEGQGPFTLLPEEHWHAACGPLHSKQPRLDTPSGSGDGQDAGDCFSPSCKLTFMRNISHILTEMLLRVGCPSEPTQALFARACQSSSRLYLYCQSIA